MRPIINAMITTVKIVIRKKFCIVKGKNMKLMMLPIMTPEIITNMKNEVNTQSGRNSPIMREEDYVCFCNLDSIKVT